LTSKLPSMITFWKTPWCAWIQQGSRWI
jgi:hypothetical protein